GGGDVLGALSTTEGCRPAHLSRGRTRPLKPRQYRRHVRYNLVLVAKGGPVRMREPRFREACQESLDRAFAQPAGASSSRLSSASRLVKPPKMESARSLGNQRGRAAL